MIEPICKNCKHVSDGATYQCTRVKDAVTGSAVSCYMERAEQLGPGCTVRVPVREPRCGAYGLHFEARVDGDA